MKTKVYDFIMKINTGSLKKKDASEYLGISRPTLDTRLMLNNWTKGEIALIQNYK